MLMVSVVSAESQDKTMELLDKYQDMRLSCEAGINKVDYEREYRDLYVATMKSEENIDKETYSKFHKILNYYDDAKTIWTISYDLCTQEDFDKLNNKYPNISKEVYHDIFGGYGKIDVANYIVKIANTEEKQLEKFLKERTVEQQKQEKTAE